MIDIALPQSPSVHLVCCLFDAQGEFEGRVRVGPEMRRPSGLQLDKDKRELYVFTLSANFSLTKTPRFTWN